MQLENDIQPYLDGQAFSNGLKIKISSPQKKVLSRVDFIENICKGKSIIHLGCTDHIPLIKDKIKNNTWLHKRLTEVADYCIGVDVNTEAINYVKEECGFNNIIELDMCNDPASPILVEKEWDYLIMGEILEHLDDPCSFLRSIKEKYPSIKNVVITVPNAFSFQNMRQSLKSIELINSDHRFWFTPYTLAKLAQIAGWKATSFDFGTYINADFFKGNIKRRIIGRILRRYPHMRDSLIMILTNADRNEKLK